ncbi:ABC transporter [Elizabethkingia miricola]|uniref:Molybdate transport system ATP-binding protein n=1 Tax=Elizabethkingia miricola TaxID=172045 RepID=A0ABY3NF97_ELIMR|nr:ATP-binding cassette domain-containing protein [Elizabethkingia miricola]OBS12170.1 ABC transporter [Elizabethkingia miricola]TYO91021.1 molybdate transport system ATP-binding protein [Elizabethkingia miricola]
MNSITLKNVSVKRGSDNLLNNISFTLNPGEHLAILGPGGSGKSLLAKALKGQLLHTGTIEYRRNNELKKPNIAYITTTYALKNKSNVSDFYYQQRFNTSDAEDSATLTDELLKKGNIESVNNWLGRFQLTHRAQAPLIQLSNGELKKMQLISHLLGNPEILILDKVFTGLDTQSRKELHAIINQLADENVRIILITDHHNIPDCITHFAEMSDGNITEYNTINQLSFTEIHQTGFDKPIPVINSSSIDSPLIRMENVTIQYNNNIILNNINWQVNPGECWQIKGHNGAGKSTLLSLINGDNPQAYSQQIYLFGKKRGSGESIWDIKKKIGFVSPELYNFFDRNTTVEQAIGSGFFDTIGLFRKLNEQQALKVKEWLSFFSLEDKATKLLSFLFGGEQRLVLIARALIKDPVMLALDEPFQGLDDSQISTIINLLEQIHQNSDISMLFISHYDDEIPSCVKHILELNKGVPTISERK